MIECKGPNTGSGAYENGTTGSISLHFTECLAEFLGITVPCSTTAESLSRTITTAGTFHNVTITSVVRGVLATLNNFTIRCQNIANAITISGSVIAEVTSPTAACPVFTKSIALKFGVTGSPATQVHKTYTESSKLIEYDLSATTAGGSAVTAALEATATNTFTEPKEVTIDCNTP